MKKILLLGGVALAAAVTTPAAAADFTGPRIEVHAGWDRLNVEDPSIKLKQKKDGVAYGAAVGYDLGIGDRFTAGVEAEFGLSTTEFESIAGNTRVQAKAKRDIAVSARLGAKLTDSVLVYAKGGYTNARLEGVMIVGGTTGTTRTEFASNGDGFRIGAGVELALTSKAYAKTEYRYSNYEGGISRHQVLAGLGLRF